MTDTSPLHPQAAAILERIIASGEPPFEQLTAAEARAIADARVLRTSAPGPAVGRVWEEVITAGARAVTLRHYLPEAAADGPVPILIYFHGGGFVVGTLDTIDAFCREMTARTGCLTVSVGYALAPEHKFPAAYEDCLAATRHVAATAAGLGADPARIALGGESSGGMIVALVAQQLAREGRLAPVLQAMVYPMLDLTTNTPSYARFADGYFLTRSKMQWFIDQTVAGPEQLTGPLASPWRAELPAGIAPALVVTAELDPLVDEGTGYAARLRAAGVPVEEHCFMGWPHGFVYWQDTDARADAIRIFAGALQRAFAPATAPA